LSSLYDLTFYFVEFMALPLRKKIVTFPCQFRELT